MFRAYRLRYYLRHRVTARLLSAIVYHNLLWRVFYSTSTAERYVSRKLNLCLPQVIMEAQAEKEPLAAAIKVQQAYVAGSLF